jgi:hypothetical protein
MAKSTPSIPTVSPQPCDPCMSCQPAERHKADTRRIEIAPNRSCTTFVALSSGVALKTPKWVSSLTVCLILSIRPRSLSCSSFFKPPNKKYIPEPSATSRNSGPSIHCLALNLCALTINEKTNIPRGMTARICVTTYPRTFSPKVYNSRCASTQKARPPRTHHWLFVVNPRNELMVELIKLTHLRLVPGQGASAVAVKLSQRAEANGRDAVNWQRIVICHSHACEQESEAAFGRS